MNDNNNNNITNNNNNALVTNSIIKLIPRILALIFIYSITSFSIYFSCNVIINYLFHSVNDNTIHSGIYISLFYSIVYTIVSTSIDTYRAYQISHNR